MWWGFYLHFPQSPDASGFYIPEIEVLPSKATVLNDSTPLSVSMDFMPSLFNGKKESMVKVCHINGIPVNKLASQAIIIKLEFDNLDSAITKTNTGETQRIL